MHSLHYFVTVYIPYIFGGGKRKYRVRQVGEQAWSVEVYGGGAGPWWAATCSDCDSYEVAYHLASKWANDTGSVLCDPVPLARSTTCGHTHTTEKGILVKCYHKCKNVLSDYGFWVGMTIGFPIEHFIWERVPPFNLLTKFLGL